MKNVQQHLPTQCRQPVPPRHRLFSATDSSFRHPLNPARCGTFLRRVLACILFAVAGSRVTAATNDFSLQPGLPQARVVIVHDPDATVAFEPRADHVQAMVDRAITNLTGAASVPAAWLSLVSTQDMIGIKVFSEPGPNSGTRPAVVAAVVRGLLSAGIAPGHILIWDKRQADLRLAGYFKLGRELGVRVAGSAEAGYDPGTSYDSPLLGHLVWGDFEFGKKGEGVGRRSFVSKLVTQHMTKIINITPLMNHNEVGVAGNLFSLAFGSVDNTMRFEGSPSRLSIAVPDIYALPVLSDRVVLNIVDALICQYEGEERSLLHYSTVLDEIWFSRDPVALDVLAIHELEEQRKKANAPTVNSNMELYDNASQLLELGVSDLRRIEVDRLP